MKLIELTVNSITTQRELFLNPLDEPHFWRTYFRRWVVEGLEEARKMREGNDDQE